MLTQTELNKQIDAALKRQSIRDKVGLRKSNCDSIVITPTVTFLEGTPENPVKHLATTKGRLVANGLISILNYISGSNHGSTNDTLYMMYSFGAGSGNPPTVPTIRVGTGSQATVHSTAQLTTPITTVPNSISGSVINTSEGVYDIIMTAVWNAGTLGSAVVTEACLYANVNSVLQAFKATAIFGVASTSVQMVDRVSVANGDFSAQTVNPSNPFTVIYRIRHAFQ